jgi:predicted O-linked N-acetylglucosamine transferase (SPINDLY family)
MLNPNVNPSEELRKLRMTDEEMFTVFVALGSIATRVHFLFNPTADFSQYARMTGEENQEAVFMELMMLNTSVGELLNEITERSINSDNEPEQAEVNRDFYGIMENGFGDDPEPPTE